MFKRYFLTIFLSFISLGIGFSQSIVINEINYNSPSDMDSNDWIEIFNHGSSTVDISGWIIKDSNDDNVFAFPANTTLTAGAYIVAVNTIENFDAVFPNVQNRIGTIDFNFSNGGELVRLYDSSEVLVDQVEYDDASPWPTEPDGDGSTLELKDPELDNSLASSWAASAGFGTPGSTNSVSVSNEEDYLSPVKFSLSQNYPNPFNPSTNISYSISKPGNVKLEVFDLLGQKVAVLVNEVQATGNYDLSFDASNLTSGIYIYRISQVGQTLTRRMTLIK
ncbi:MAG: lamin tail domain-containing protein [Balneolaceae bacterium]